MSALGSHLLVDFWDVAPELLSDVRRLRRALVRCAWLGGATVVDTRFGASGPQGVSGLIILAESHLAVHTWPDRSFAAVDVFTCGEPEVATQVVEQIVQALKPGRHNVYRVERGATSAATVRATQIE